MTEKEAIEIFEKVHSLHEQMDMENDIRDIGRVLSQRPIDLYQVRTQIDIVNRKHPENVILYNLIFPPHGNSVSLANASDQNLIDDLAWKQIYLQAKKAGKLFGELCKEVRKS